MKKEEESMYKAIRKGNIKAFESFYKKYQPRLFAYGIGILTKDLVQEAFISFWENKEHILTDYSVTAYLFKIFHVKCSKYLRMKSIVTNFSHLSELKLQEMEISFYNPDENILGSIFMHDVEKLYKKALDQLPEQCREIFVLSRQEEMKSAEIAFKLGLSVRTVENQIYKAMRIMREEMKEYALPIVMLLMMVKELF
jgi:RNA polymerase sigma-70 factor (ECF subfamily)